MKTIFALLAAVAWPLLSCSHPFLTERLTKQTASAAVDQPSQALKQLLDVAVQEAAKKLSAPDGYFKNQAIKILLPPEAKDVEKTLRQLGMGKLVDDAILSMNRAAEDAAKQAVPVFADAIKKMTLTDVQQIVSGTPDAATQFLKKATYSQLKTRYTPIVDQALKKSQATKYWKDIFTRYNKIPGVKKVNPNLSEHVVTKALDGFFQQLAQEEKKIRQNPEATANELIRWLFGK
ncbi:MAG: DUF4197 domain-containing protein [Chitinophagales bacterium]|nr:DUF4197 domain-containing protein [Chitinophagales bacterium]MDW8393996.1 DUF4197 domain-containing protein [Chitinophagales bacterium]